jgi:hypothetical protein
MDFSQVADYLWVGSRPSRLIRWSESRGKEEEDPSEEVEEEEPVEGEEEGEGEAGREGVYPEGVALGWRRRGVLEEMPLLHDYERGRVFPAEQRTLRGRYAGGPIADPSEAVSEELATDSNEENDPDDFFFRSLTTTASRRLTRPGLSPGRGGEGSQRGARAGARTGSKPQVSMQQRQFQRQQRLSSARQREREKRVPLEDRDQQLSQEPLQVRSNEEAEDYFFG